ncbi:MAG: GTP-binding protein [Pseudomonadota bacterium]
MTTDFADGRMRLTILGGYLGSGKTTWLRHQLHVGSFGDVHVIVNEAAETGVDDVLLKSAKGLTLLAGGCSCCTGRQDLITALRTLCDQQSRDARDAPRLQRIVLETSGLADPAAILAAIQGDPVVVNHIVIDQTIVVVDALHGLAQLQTEPLGRRQIGAADRLIISKGDAVAATDLTLLRATLRALNPSAAQSAAILGAPQPLADLPEDAQAQPLPPLSDEDTRGAIFPTRITIDPEIDWSAFALWLSALLHARGNDLVRVKGVLPTPAGRLLLQTVRKVVQSPEILPVQANQTEDGTIVFLGRGFGPEDLQKSLRKFTRSRPSP